VDNASNHNGGQLQYGPDGGLYLSVGDDADGNTAQDPAGQRGKILRLDPSGLTPSGTVWAQGLRNPWRLSFDRATGAMYIADVGAGAFEEISIGAEGRNYGWPTCEGFSGVGCTSAAFTPPIYAYANDATTCAITGGYVVRDPDLSELFGRYLFADYCGGELLSIDPTAPPAVGGHRAEGLMVSQPVSFGEDSCGRLYVVSRAGQVYRLEGPAGGVCPPDIEAPQTTLELDFVNRRRSRAFARLGANEPSTFECRLDGRGWKECGERHELRRLRPGRHRFRARATDLAGNTDSTPAKKRFKVKRR
jgi:hypothetical protein